MKQRDNKTCAQCYTQHSWWQTTTCIHCGQCVCRKDTLLLRRNYSTVLAAVCKHCAAHMSVPAATFQKVEVHV
jgi:hypothetical protein